MLLASLFERDLKRLSEEIKAYTTETAIWQVAPGIANSGGNLCLHLCGNLQHFIGAILGNSGYVRVREKEFSDKDIPIDKLLAEIDATQRIVHTVISGLSPEALQALYTGKPLGEEITVEKFLTHLYGHLNYHLGQINYHRRLIH
ncbi:DinB family protein [Chitinophaga vietnamensis]|uniref:DinB family protein n=1 Tax=Chitinophaga vietnamensis TaxID=2593957 RepID=UPI00117750F7|nr:DinB family protein [Chitinophaga vietnamensis]